MTATTRFDALPRFATSLKAIESLKPTEPLYLVLRTGHKDARRPRAGWQIPFWRSCGAFGGGL